MRRAKPTAGLYAPALIAARLFDPILLCHPGDLLGAAWLLRQSSVCITQVYLRPEEEMAELVIQIDLNGPAD